jgi:hypothetical protein
VIIEAEDFVKHFGTRGMRWGVRNSRDSNSFKPNRKERRQEKRLAKNAAQEKKVNDIIKTSLKQPTRTLVLLNGQQVVTGKEFVDHMTAGGRMNVKTTRIYARQQGKTGPFVLEPKSR